MGTTQRGGWRSGGSCCVEVRANNLFPRFKTQRTSNLVGGWCSCFVCAPLHQSVRHSRRTDSMSRRVSVGKSVRHTSSVYTRSRGWHSHEVYCAEGSLRNLFSRVTSLAYKEFNRRMVFVSLLFTGHPSVRHPARSNLKQTAEAQFPA